MEDKKAKQREQARERKRRQRERLQEFDIKVVEVKLSVKEREQLARNCQIRGGVNGPYDTDEYISTLIRRDTERLNRQLKKVEKCPKCSSTFPEGCGGLFRGDSECWQTTGYKRLAL
ncbi:hypothetical protein MYC06_004738 [Vibrio parahaemolyticus]|nr:hypothetical protein [Vibrio parahaemolyticus]EJC7066904.1 hypothetical protein [Vibrio parahaemolyticus]